MDSLPKSKLTIAQLLISRELLSTVFSMSLKNCGSRRDLAKFETMTMLIISNGSTRNLWLELNSSISKEWLRCCLWGSPRMWFLLLQVQMLWLRLRLQTRCSKSSLVVTHLSITTCFTREARLSVVKLSSWPRSQPAKPVKQEKIDWINFSWSYL